MSNLSDRRPGLPRIALFFYILALLFSLVFIGAVETWARMGLLWLTLPGFALVFVSRIRAGLRPRPGGAPETWLLLLCGYGLLQIVPLPPWLPPKSCRLFARPSMRGQRVWVLVFPGSGRADAQG